MLQPWRGYGKRRSGGVADQELMAGATMFLSMKLADSAKQAADMARVSTQLGMAMNEFALMLANQAYPRLDLFGMSAGTARRRVAELKSEIPGLSQEVAFMTAEVQALDREGCSHDGSRDRRL